MHALETLSIELEKALDTTFNKLLSTEQVNHLAGFALCTDEEAHSIYHVYNTIDNSIDLEIRFSPYEWDKELDDSIFNEVNNILEDLDYSESLTHAVFTIFFNSLKTLKDKFQDSGIIWDQFCFVVATPSGGNDLTFDFFNSINSRSQVDMQKELHS